MKLQQQLASDFRTLIAKDGTTYQPYTGPYKYKSKDGTKTDLMYVHFHHQSIGYAQNGNPTSDEEIAKRFITSRNQNKQIAKTHYKEVVKTNITDPAIKLLNKSVDDEYVDKIIEYISKELESSVNLDHVQTVSNHQATINIENIVNKKSVEDIATLLKAIRDSLKVIDAESSDAATIALLLREVNKHSSVDAALKAMHTKAEMLLKNTVFTVNQTRLKNIIKYLNNIANTLLDNEFLSKDLDKQINSISSSINNNIFSGQIQEYLAQKALGVAADKLKGKIQDSAKNNTKKVTFEQGELAEIAASSSRNGKADVIMQDIRISIDEMPVQLNIGVSVKGYSGIKIKRDSSGRITGASGTADLGGGVKLGSALDMMYGAATRNNYFAYNTIAWERDNKNSYAIQALKADILTRQFVNLVAARGTEDMSEFLLINGVIIPTWDLLKIICNSDIPLNAAKEKEMGITISFSGTQSITSDTLYKSAFHRLLEINNNIRQSSVHAKIRMGKLKNAMQKSSNFTLLNKMT